MAEFQPDTNTQASVLWVLSIKSDYYQVAALGCSFLSALLLRNIVEKRVGEQNVHRNICFWDWRNKKNSGNEADLKVRASVWSRGETPPFGHMSIRGKKSCICIPQTRRHVRVHMFGVCSSSPRGECFLDMSVFVLAVVTKSCLCESGEADDGICGASGCRRRFPVQRRGLWLHPQSAVHLSRRWDQARFWYENVV